MYKTFTMSTYCEPMLIYNNTVRKKKQPSAGVASRELMCNSRAVLYGPNATTFDEDFKTIKGQPVLVFADNGVGMYPNTFDCLAFKARETNGMYSGWGEGMKEAICHFISEDPRSMAYIYTWNGEKPNKSADVACIETSNQPGVFERYGYADIYLSMTTQALADKIKRDRNRKNKREPLVQEHDNPNAAFADVEELIDHLKEYATRDDHGTVIEIWHPRVDFDDEGRLLCTEKGKTVYDYISQSMIPQCPQQNLFVCNWLKNMTIRIQGKRVNFKLWSPRDSISEVITIRDLEEEEIAKMVIKNTKDVNNLSRDSFTEKLSRTGQPSKAGEFAFMLSDLIVATLPYNIITDHRRQNEEYPTYLFLFGYENRLTQRCKYIYRALTYQISDEDFSIDTDGVYRHEMTDQIITFERLLSGLEEARQMSYDQYGMEGKGQPTAMAPIERFLQRFCLLPYRAYIAPKKTTDIFERMKTSVDTENNRFLMQRIKFEIGMWAARELRPEHVEEPILPDQPLQHPVMYDQADNHEDESQEQAETPTSSLGACQDAGHNSYGQVRRLDVDEDGEIDALQNQVGMTPDTNIGATGTVGEDMNDTDVVQHDQMGTSGLFSEAQAHEEHGAKRARRTPKGRSGTFVKKARGRPVIKKTTMKTPSWDLMKKYCKLLSGAGEDDDMEHVEQFRTIKEFGQQLSDHLKSEEITEAAALCKSGLEID